ncbi:MAG: hypothetical protein IKY49_04075 [Paludibacteraceae bacterium]|nr:hypothetical protein [Paludibacteraceae bacterium]
MQKLPYILLIICAGVGLAIGAVMLVDHLSKDKYDGRRLVTEQPDHLAQDEVLDVSQYKSPDLQMQLAKGNVNSIEYEYEKLNYTPNGLLIKNDDYITIDIKRNEKGQIISILESAEEEISEEVYYYTYDNNGFVKEQTYSYACFVEGESYESYTKYTYKGEELMKEETREWADIWGHGDGVEAGKSESTTIATYTNYKYDNRGNWISREKKRETNSKLYELDESLGNIIRFVKEENNSNSVVQKRTITYYNK